MLLFFYPSLVQNRPKALWGQKQNSIWAPPRSTAKFTTHLSTANINFTLSMRDHLILIQHATFRRTSRQTEEKCHNRIVPWSTNMMFVNLKDNFPIQERHSLLLSYLNIICFFWKTIFHIDNYKWSSWHNSNRIKNVIRWNDGPLEGVGEELDIII